MTERERKTFLNLYEAMVRDGKSHQDAEILAELCIATINAHYVAMASALVYAEELKESAA